MGRSRPDRLPTDVYTTRVFGDDFIPDRSRLIGASDTAHQVSFGKHYDSANGEWREVAAKPFLGPRAAEKAKNETRLTAVLRDLGFRTLSPVLVAEGDGVAILLTNYVPGLIGANALPLEAHPSTALGESVGETAASIAATLGRLHASHVTHGDAQIKNFGLKTHGPAGQEPIVMDLEKATHHKNTNPAHREKAEYYFNRATQGDLRVLSDSMGFRSYGGRGIRRARKHFTDTIIEPYQETVRSLDQSLLPQSYEQAYTSFYKGREMAHYIEAKNGKGDAQAAA
ncbi:MAG TPA: lipopolysaccharide kinase InaA family protein [Candidatus Saccharimonadales bacterium]|nr:lipopolysaccharide kinase InaA family protein [Candidatus Saccharimonadales bacterium]